MFGIGMTELIIIMVIILVIFGAGKLPEIGKGLGKGIGNFKKSVQGTDDIESSAKHNDVKNTELNDKGSV